MQVRVSSVGLGEVLSRKVAVLSLCSGRLGAKTTSPHSCHAIGRRIRPNPSLCRRRVKVNQVDAAHVHTTHQLQAVSQKYAARHDQNVPVQGRKPIRLTSEYGLCERPLSIV